MKFYVETWTEDGGWERVGERSSKKGAIAFLEKTLPSPYIATTDNPARMTREFIPPKTEWRENLKMTLTFHAERQEHVSGTDWKTIGRVWS